MENAIKINAVHYEVGDVITKMAIMISGIIECN